MSLMSVRDMLNYMPDQKSAFAIQKGHRFEILAKIVTHLSLIALSLVQKY